MERAIVGLSRLLGVIAASAIVVLMVAIIIDVVTRYVTGRSVPWMLEISESSLVVSIFFALAWAGVKGAHVSVTLLSDRVGPAANRVFDVIAWTLGTGLTGWFVAATATRALTATRLNETRMGLVQWQTWPLRWAIVVGMAALLLVCAANLLRVLRGRATLSDDPAVAGVPAESSPPTEAG